jgi:hypothetical protein
MQEPTFLILTPPVAQPLHRYGIIPGGAGIADGSAA